MRLFHEVGQLLKGYSPLEVSMIVANFYYSPLFDIMKRIPLV